ATTRSASRSPPATARSSCSPPARRASRRWSGSSPSSWPSPRAAGWPSPSCGRGVLVRSRSQTTTAPSSRPPADARRARQPTGEREVTVAEGRLPTVERSPADDDLVALEEQRDFLLRSLDDLEREREAGDLDDDDYQALKDDYTARA